MRVFIVEDDPHKLNQLRREVDSYKFVSDVRTAVSLEEAMNTLETQSFDIVLLDMAIPSHGGSAASMDVYSQPVGGLDILLFLATSARAERIMILTQYPTIEYNREHIPLRRFLPKLVDDGIRNLEGAVLFSEDGAWKRRLKDFLEEKL